MNRVVHFEIQADDIERAMEFYKNVFGWEFQKWMDNPLYYGIISAPKDSNEPGINGGLLKRRTRAPEIGQGANSYICTVQVEDFDETAKKIGQAGGEVAVPKHDIMGMAWQGYFVDTEGNTFGVHQPLKK